jgi:hypothetical protein
MGIGGPELLIIVFLLAGLVVPIVCIWAAIDAGSQPEAAFEAVGTTKTLWIVLPLVGMLVCFVGIVAAILWFTNYRPRVRAAAGLT